MFNQILQPRWSAQLIRRFAMKVQGSPAPTLAPEIAPSIDVNDPDIASWFLRQEKPLAFATRITAAAGFYSTFQMRNPTGSGVLVAVDYVLGFTSGAAVWTGVIATTTDLTNAGAMAVMDTRWAGTLSPTPVRYSWRNNSAGAIVGTNRPGMIVGFDYQPIRAVISPGFAFVIESAAVNQQVDVGIMAREIPLPPEEEQNG